eukprot:364800-Chlamydomonas_euryale.AAC.7
MASHGTPRRQGMEVQAAGTHACMSTYKSDHASMLDAATHATGPSKESGRPRAPRELPQRSPWSSARLLTGCRRLVARGSCIEAATCFSPRAAETAAVATNAGGRDAGSAARAAHGTALDGGADAPPSRLAHRVAAHGGDTPGAAPQGRRKEPGWCGRR